jgi:hypothetical protein
VIIHVHLHHSDAKETEKATNIGESNELRRKVLEGHVHGRCHCTEEGCTYRIAKSVFHASDSRRQNRDYIGVVVVVLWRRDEGRGVC